MGKNEISQSKVDLPQGRPLHQFLSQFTQHQHIECYSDAQNRKWKTPEMMRIEAQEQPPVQPRKMLLQPNGRRMLMHPDKPQGPALHQVL